MLPHQNHLPDFCIFPGFKPVEIHSTCQIGGIPLISIGTREQRGGKQGGHFLTQLIVYFYSDEFGVGNSDFNIRDRIERVWIILLQFKTRNQGI
jgi:hypothetical protein